MVLTRAQIDERLKAVQTQRENMISQIHALDGVVMDLNFWLAQLEGEEKAKAPIVGGSTETSTSADVPQEHGKILPFSPKVS